MYWYFQWQCLLPMTVESKKVATPAAQKKDYREAFKVVTTGKKRKKEEMFRALPAATALMLSPTRSKKHGHLESCQ